MYEMMGFCGINCGECEIRRAANDREFAEKLIEIWKESDPDVNESWLKCQGCKGPGDICWGNDCAIRICAMEKGVDHCGQCAGFKCILINRFEADKHLHHTKAVKKLETMS